jgi:hypothetical protein
MEIDNVQKHYRDAEEAEREGRFLTAIISREEISTIAFNTAIQYLRHDKALAGEGFRVAARNMERIHEIIKRSGLRLPGTDAVLRTAKAYSALSDQAFEASGRGQNAALQKEA